MKLVTISIPFINNIGLAKLDIWSNQLKENLIESLYYNREYYNIASRNLPTMERNIEIKKHFERLPESIIKKELSRFADEKTLELALKILEPRELISLLSWVESNYGKFYLGVEEIPEEGPAFITIFFEDCENWDELAKQIKSGLKTAGMENLISKVAIICLKSLQKCLI